MSQIKSDWYQTETSVVVTLLIRNLKQENLRIVCSDDRTLEVSIKLEDIEHELKFNLAHKVDGEALTHKISSTKVEIKLKKLEGIQWNKLEGDPNTETPKSIPTTFASASAASAATRVVEAKRPLYPSSKGTDWSAVEKELNEQEKKEKPEGEEALNGLFQKIYGEGNDEVKKAMNKSFFESGGTVLSTNWKDIAEKTVEVKPPDGMEFKKWDS